MKPWSNALAATLSEILDLFTVGLSVGVVFYEIHLNTFQRKYTLFLSEAPLKTTADTIAPHYHLIVYMNNQMT
jgi:hypothetical protein